MNRAHEHIISLKLDEPNRYFFVSDKYSSLHEQE